jgi:D-aminoacyl-tRNA deacylase
MIALIQRVSEASVRIDDELVGAIGPGLVALVAVEAADTPRAVDRTLDRLLGYRVFPDDQGRMNRSLRETGGGLLLVPQFTLAADTQKGMRPSFSGAATPEQGARLFQLLLTQGAVRASGRGQRSFRRRHAGRTGQRGTRDLLAPDPPLTVTRLRTDGESACRMDEKIPPIDLRMPHDRAGFSSAFRNDFRLPRFAP